MDNFSAAAQFKYNIFRCCRTLRSEQINHDELEDFASHPSTSSLALRARGCFRWSRARGHTVFWKGFRYSWRALPYSHCSHGVVRRDGPGPRCLTPFASEPRLFLPAAGSIRRDRGDSSALSGPVSDVFWIVGAYRVLAQRLATKGGGSAAG